MANWSFTESYDTPAQKNIILTVTDERGETRRDRISILILNSSFVMSYIDSPRWGESYGRTIAFNGSGSYVAEYKHATRQVFCLAGMCPLITGNCPVVHPTPNCNNLTVRDAPGPGIPANYSKLSFDWEVTNGFTGRVHTRTTSGPDMTISFDTPSVPARPHKAKLTARPHKAKLTVTYTE